jgi:Tfp pilus assembly protein PilO
MPGAGQNHPMKLSADKRNKLIMVAVATVIIIGLLWYYLIGALNTKLTEFKEKQAAAEEQRKKIDTAAKNSAKIEASLNLATEKLTAIKQEMASGDLYSWMYTTIKNFTRPYHVDIPQFSTVETSDNTLISKFPYKQVKITLNGSAYFHDFGRFLSDFENQFSHFRVENLILDPASSADREKLAFRMDVIALVNNAPATDNK